MGLDIVIYRENQKNEIIEINEKFHKAIFLNTNDLLATSFLMKIKDYYKTNIQLDQYQIKMLIDDLNKINNATKLLFPSEIHYLSEKLNDENIIKIHITGD